MPTYKANRSGMARPIHLGTVRKTMCQRFDHRVVDGLEADDIIGVLATREKYADAIIVSPDKDLLTVPGRHLSPLKDDGVIVISEAEANRRWMLQTLMGDTSDGYKGIPRVGPVKAAKLLGTARTLPAMWRAVVQAYRDAGLTEDDALMTARVARILRDTDYDKASKEVRGYRDTRRRRGAHRDATHDHAGEPEAVLRRQEAADVTGAGHVHRRDEPRDA